MNALEPHVSQKRLNFTMANTSDLCHEFKQSYKRYPLAQKKLEEIILESAKDPAKAGLFNNSAQFGTIHSFGIV
jgi:Fe-Mn family superoxide dismutase